MNKLNDTVKKATGGVCDTCKHSKSNSGNELVTSFKKNNFRFFCLKGLLVSFTEGEANPCSAYYLKYSIRLNIAIKKISYQFPETPEGKLMFAIIGQAINDLKDNGNRGSAKSFLTKKMPQAEVCGVNSNWIKSVLIDCNVI